MVRKSAVTTGNRDEKSNEPARSGGKEHGMKGKRASCGRKGGEAERTSGQERICGLEFHFLRAIHHVVFV